MFSSILTIVLTCSTFYSNRCIISDNMPLVYTQSNDENYPPITSMMRKTKRDESRTMGGNVNKRPALATISNIQSTTSNSDLGKVRLKPGWAEVDFRDFDLFGVFFWFWYVRFDG